MPSLRTRSESFVKKGAMPLSCGRHERVSMSAQSAWREKNKRTGCLRENESVSAPEGVETERRTQCGSELGKASQKREGEGRSAKRDPGGDARRAEGYLRVQGVSCAYKLEGQEDAPGKMQTLPPTRTTGTHISSWTNRTSESFGKRAIRFLAVFCSSVCSL